MTTQDSLPANEEDEQTRAALSEYIATLDSEAAMQFQARLDADPALRAAVTQAISAMAMLFAASYMVEDDDEYESIAENIFETAIFDPPDVRQLRRYYFANAEQIDFQASSLSASVINQRLLRQFEAYQALHP